MEDNDQLFDKLLTKYIAQEISAKDKEQMFSMLFESPVYKEQYEKAMKLSTMLHVPRFEMQKQENAELFLKTLKKSSTKGITTNWWIYLRNTAAILLLMISVSLGTLLVYTHSATDNDVAFYETIVPLGSQTKIILPDGSAAFLNSGSTLKYPLSFGKKDRVVFLEGEGYFEVAKDQSKTFLVYVSDVKVQVTGTKFNVRSYMEDHSVEVCLLEGGVDVMAFDKSIRLKPDEKAIYSNISKELIRLPSESYKATLWITGKLNFVNTSFTDILKDIERKFNVKIHIESQRAYNESFSGSINLNQSVEEVFNIIDMDKKYIFERTDSIIILKDR